MLFWFAFYPIYAAGPKLNLISHWGVDISTKLMALKIYFAVFVKLNLAIFVKLNLAIFAKLNLSCSCSWQLFANWTHSLEPARLLSPSPKLIKLLTKNINWITIILKKRTSNNSLTTRKLIRTLSKNINWNTIFLKSIS